MVSQADLDLIQNFAIELEPFVETVLAGVREFEKPSQDTLIVGQAVQSLGMIRGAGSILMVEPLTQIIDMLTEGFDVLQSSGQHDTARAATEMLALAGTLRECLDTLVQGQDAEAVVVKARQRFDALMGGIAGAASVGHTGSLLRRPTEALEEPTHMPTPEPVVSAIPRDTQEVAAQAEEAAPPEISTEPQEELDPELRDIFLEEAAELMVSFRDNAIALARVPDDRVVADALRRDAHTIKGAANMTGFTLIGQVGAAVENLLDEYLDRELPLDRDALEMLLVCWKMLPAMLRKLDDLSMFAAPVDSVTRRSEELIGRFAEAPAPDAVVHEEPVQTEDTVVEVTAEATVEEPVEEAAPEDVVLDRPVVTPARDLLVDPPYLDQFGRERPQTGAEFAYSPAWNTTSLPPVQPPPVEPETPPVAEVEADERPAVPDAPSRERLDSALLDLAFSEDVQAPDPVVAESVEQPVEVYAGDDEAELFDLFSAEASDLIEVMNRAAMEMERGSDPARARRDLIRALHTLKGAASAGGLEVVADECHQLEEVLADGKQDAVTSVFGALERIETAIDRRRVELYGGEDVPAPEDAGARLRVPVARLDSLLNLVGELVVNRAGFEQRLERLTSALDELSLTAERLQRSGASLERRTLPGGPAFGPTNQTSEWDDLEFDRYTEFDRLVRELTEIGADISASVNELGQLRGDLATVSTRQRRLTTSMQDELMDVRMVPISSIAPRLYRVIRQVAAARGKDVRLVFEGGETTFDSTLLEALSESLLHLLRNAVDHGIETPVERRARGKSSAGTIRVRSWRDGGESVIDIIDDGAGIDEARVLRRARELGLVAGESPSRRELLRMVFRPGFTTRESADEVSGRGVGLDIVESAVARFKGRLNIDSTPGKGTVISLRLPVMLSVTQAFMVTAGGEKYAVPIGNIDFVADRREQPLARIGDSLVLEVDDTAIPAVDLAARLGQRASVSDQEDGWIMVAQVAGERWALCVDELEGQQEIVVKPLGRFLRHTAGVVGATILGNGDVALIVDVPRLISTGAETTATLLDTPAVDDGEPGFERSDETQPVALIVDDSLSVRRVVGRTLERYGWRPVLARDGHEALEMLEHTPVTAIITDIEMPRMDGYELMGALGTVGPHGRVPVVVLTSRSGQKHRERAFELGAGAYVVKPFQEQQLVEALESVTGVRVANGA